MTADPVLLYGYWRSSSSYRVRIALNLKGIAYQYKAVHLLREGGEQKQAAYRADITYGTNNEFGFDYLRDNMAFTAKERVQRGRCFAVIDEVDSILIDEARTPLIISGPMDERSDLYLKINALIPS